MLPKSLQIQTIDDCNRKCAWCPNSRYEKSKGLMDFDLYVKILKDLKHVDYRGNIHLYLMGEPTMDERLTDFISTARRMFPDNSIFISTNGDYLKTEDDIKRLFCAGLTWMGISHYDHSNRHLYEFEKRYPICNTTMNGLRAEFYNRGGHAPNVGCINPRPLCSWVFDKAYVNWKGQMVLCCSDYLYEVVFGELSEKSFDEVYNCDAYNAYREAHRAGNGKDMKLCRACNRIREKNK